MAWSGCDLLRGTHLHQFAVLHHGNSIGEVTHHRQGVRDKQVGKLKVFLQVGGAN